MSKVMELQQSLRQRLLRLWPRRGLLLRTLLCLMIGVGTYFLDQNRHYDLRFSLRGSDPNKSILSESSQILILEISQQLAGYNSAGGRFSDTHYFESEVWSQMLSEILERSPFSVGVTLFLEPQLGANERPTDAIFYNPKILWASREDKDGRVVYPLLTDERQQNAAMTRYSLDSDGNLRFYQSSLMLVPEMAMAMTRKNIRYSQKGVINFLGPRGSYETYTLRSLDDLRSVLPKINNKIVIIGPEFSEENSILTPVGQLSRAEVYANLVDNINSKKWIRTLPFSIDFLILLGMLLLTVLVVLNLPQTVALLMFFWIGVTFCALSFWVFDAFYIAIPIMPMMVQLLVTYLVFLSFRLTEKDYLNWRLDKERQSLLELEQLKNNFVSLFSHDLKTPIAKIQAICDRIISQNSDNQELTTELNKLRGISTELHRYIQSILQITRVEARDFKLNKEPADLNELAFSAISQLRDEAQQKGIVLTEQFEPLFLTELDANLIREVVLNLLENAVKYSPKDTQIEVSTREENGRIHLEIKDQGPGVNEAEKRKIFDKFYRGKAQIYDTKGSGLGLYLVKYFVDLHGGEVIFESQPQAGTKAGFSLPID